jgi:hypothetical protein
MWQAPKGVNTHLRQRLKGGREPSLFLYCYLYVSIAVRAAQTRRRDNPDMPELDGFRSDLT